MHDMNLDRVDLYPGTPGSPDPKWLDGLPTVDDMGDEQRSRSQALLEHMAGGEGYSHVIARTMYGMIKRYDETAHFIQHSQDLSKQLAGADPEQAEALNQRIEVLDLATKYSNSSRLEGYRNAAQLARATAAIADGLEETLNSPTLNLGQVEKRIDLYRDLSFIPAAIEARDQDRREAEIEAENQINLNNGQDMSSVRMAVGTPTNSGEEASAMKALDEDVFRSEIQGSSRERRLKLTEVRDQLTEIDDPISVEANDLRSTLLADNIILDRDRRKQVKVALMRGDIAQKAEAESVHSRTAELQDAAKDEEGRVDPKLLQGVLLESVKKQAKTLDAPGQDGFLRDHRVSLNSIIRMAEMNDGAISSRNLNAATNILATKGMSQSESRIEIQAMRGVMRLEEGAMKAIDKQFERPSKSSRDHDERD